MLQPRIYLLGLLPFRPIIRIGCRPTPAECGLHRPAAPARQIAGVRMTRLHGSAVLGSVRLSLERGDLEPGPVGAPGTSTACLWLSLVPADSHGPAKMRGPARPQFRSEDRFGSTTDLTALKPDFRFTPESGLNSDIAPCPKSANNGHRSLLDHLISSAEQFERNRKA
jgi:hypothetical protein